MTDFLDPGQFDNEEDLLGYILDHLVKPKLKETLGEDLERVELSGVAYIFGSRDGNQEELVDEIQHLQGYLEEGLSLEYVISEMTDLEVRQAREGEYRGLVIRYVEVERGDGDAVAPLTADELQVLYDRPAADGRDRN